VEFGGVLTFDVERHMMRAALSRLLNDHDGSRVWEIPVFPSNR